MAEPGVSAASGAIDIEVLEEQESAALRFLTAGTARIASATGLRQVLSIGMLAVTAAVVARCLGPHSFGVYSAGIAAFSLTSSLTDLGFSLYLSREMSQRPGDENALMSAALPAQMLWACVPTLVLLTLALIAGGGRGAVMLALCPAILFSGFGVSRQIFGVRFIASPLLILDVSTTVLQCMIMIVLAVTHAPLVMLACNLTVFSVAVGSISFLLARRLVTFTRPPRAAVVRFVRAALPLGTASVLASLYFTIDMTLLGWLVRPRSVGEYAAAVRLLNVVVMLPGFIMAAGIPGLSRTASDRGQLSSFAATLAHWIAVTALPAGVCIAVFARPLVLAMFGAAYVGSIPLVRILMLAALLSFVSNITGIVLMTQGIIRPQIIFNVVSLVVNVAGNLLLVPRYGVVASAWLTVVSEAVVVSYGLVLLRHRLHYPMIAAQVWRPLVAIAVSSAVALALRASQAPAMVLGPACFVLGMSALRAWPAVLVGWVTARVSRR